MINIQKFPNIRAAMYRLIGSMCLKCPDLLAPHLQSITPLIFNCYSEKEIVVHEHMMDTLVTYLKTFPDVWKLVNVDKAVFSKLRNFLRTPDTSSPSLTYPILLPFMSLLNYSVCIQTFCIYK